MASNYGYSSDTNTSSNSNNPISDVQVDALPEDDQIISSGEDELIDLNVSAKQKTQQETAAKRDVVGTNQLHTAQDTNLHKYLPYFPKHLREECIDFLVIHTEEDYDDATQFKDKIEQNVKFYEDLTPNVALLKDIGTDFHVEQLDYAFSRAHTILVYVTNELCDNKWKLSEAHACLKKAMEDDEVAKSVICVRTDSKQSSRVYKLPMHLDSQPKINYFDNSYIKEATTLLQDKLDVILDRRHALKKERQKYFQKNYHELNEKKRTLALSANNAMSGYNEKSPRKLIDKDHRKDLKMNPKIQQQMSQYSVSKKHNSIMGLQDDLSSIEVDGGEVLTVSSRSRPKPDGNEAVPFNIPSQVHSTHAKAAFSDVSGQSLNQRQNVQQGCSSAHTSIDQTKKVANESGYYSSALEGSTVSFSSLPEPDDNKAVPINVPAQVYSTYAQASGKQSIADSVGSESRSSHQSVKSDTN